MHELAQTNLQLYNELIALGWHDSELTRVRVAYEMAADLFSGRYRASGKTFVAHLVGTASCVAAVDGRPPLVCAALLHAAYESGDFGFPGDLVRRRTAIRARVGADVEELVFEYSRFPWSVATIRESATNPQTLPGGVRDVVILRLANEVDEHADLGTRFADRDDDPLYRPDAIDSMGHLARALEHDALARRFDRLAHSDCSLVPPVLRSDQVASVLKVPASYRPSFRTSVSRGGRRLRRQLRRAPGVAYVADRIRARSAR